MIITLEKGIRESLGFWTQKFQSLDQNFRPKHAKAHKSREEGAKVHVHWIRSAVYSKALSSVSRMPLEKKHDMA